MAKDLIDTYQLSSLIELTNSLAEDSINSTLNVEQIITQSVDKLMWIINFELCIVLEKSNIDNVNVILNNEGVKHNLSNLAQLPIDKYTQNMEVQLSEQSYFLFYNVLHKDSTKAKLILFLQRSDRFSSQSAIVLELFCSSVKKLIETKNNELKNRQLQNEKAILEESNKLKSMFLATISHEIKTPMNGILGMVQLFKDTPLNQQQQHMLSTICDSSNEFLKILDNILEYSSLENDQVTLNETNFDCTQEVGAIIEKFSNKASSKEINLTSLFTKDLPTGLYGDLEKIKRIVCCLVDNAIKFTQSGEVNVAVNCQQTPSNIYQVNIDVTDTGIGISESLQKQLFGTFIQADSSMTRKYSGMGLSLAICSRLAKILNGEIRIKSKESKGSLFSFSVPLKLAQNQEKDCLNDSSTQNLPSIINLQHKILVVEDTRINQVIAKNMLLKLDLECDIATNGLEALLALEKCHYTLIFMDLQMPEMDGLTATSEIVKRYERSRPLIVAMTANTSHEDRENCRLVGMDDFIAKPIEASELRRVLSTHYKPKLGNTR